MRPPERRRGERGGEGGRVTLYDVERGARRARQLQKPGRYVRNRLIAKALGMVGVWSLLRKAFR